MIACGVNPAGSREILAVEPMFDESEHSWRVFFRKLKARGMKRAALCISDAHAGIQASVKRRRSRVVGVFPAVESYLRLTICYLV